MNDNHSILELKFNWRFLVAFLLLEFICMQGHEIIHHLTGRVICGAWGTMTFLIFTLPGSCFETNSYALLATAAGPALSYFLMWAGMLFLLRTKHSLLGFSLIFANLPFARFITVAINSGDEMVIARRLFGEGSWLIVLSLTVMILLPPLTTAFRAIGNRRRLLIFSGFLVLPLLFDAVLKRVVLASLFERWEMRATPVFGIPLFVIVVDFLALTAFFFCRKYLFQNTQQHRRRLMLKRA